MMRATLIALCLLAACAPSQDAKSEPEAPVSSNSVAAPTPSDVRVRITAAQKGQSVRVGVGDRFAVELVGVPTAGYVWEPKTLPGFVTRAGEASGNTTTQQSQPGFTGGNHWEVFLFAATGPGTGQLVFEQKRPWETNEPPSDTFTVTIVAE